MVCLTNKLSCTYFVRSQVNEAESHRPNSKVVNVLSEVIVDKDKLCINSHKLYTNSYKYFCPLWGVIVFL